MADISYKEDGGVFSLPKTLYGVKTWYVVSALAAITLIILYVMLNILGLLGGNIAFAKAIADSLGIISTGIFFAVSLTGLIRSKNLNILPGIIAFAVSSISYFIAEVLWAVYNFVLSVNVPYPSIADVFYLAGSIAFVAGIYLIKQGLQTKPRIDQVIIVVIAVGSTLIACLTLYIIVISGNPVGLSTFLDVAYPVLDYISLVLVTSLFVVSRGRSVAEAQAILTAGIVITALSDISFSFGTAMGLYSGVSLIDFLFVIGYLLFAIGIWRYVALTREDILKDRLSKISQKAKA